jgi:hypothetical protein
MGSTTWTPAEVVAFAKRQQHHAVAAVLEECEKRKIIGAGGEVPTATAPGRRKRPTRAKYSHEVVRAYFVECGLPAPAFEYRFDLRRKWRFDVAWAFPKCPIALEVQGGIWSNGRHTRGAALLKEWEKLNEAACQGWRILYVQPDDLCLLSTVQLIKRCLANETLPV